MAKKRAFTLVELMVVLVIAVVIAGILIPVIQKAYQAGARTRCMANAHVLTTAVLSYAADSEGSLPFTNWDSDVNFTGSYGIGWLFACPQCRNNFPANLNLNGGWNAALSPANGAMTGALWPYTKSLTVYHCPIDDPTFYYGTNAMTSFLMNGAMSGYGRIGYSEGGEITGSPNVSFPSYTLRLFKNPQACVLFWEAYEQTYKGASRTGAVWNDGSSYPSEEVLADRHEKGATCTFLDGHVQWVDGGRAATNGGTAGGFDTNSTWCNWLNQSPGPLWCVPISPNGH